jgi:MoxR-like ATPase
MADPQAARALATELSTRVDERLFGMETPLRLVMVGIVTGSHVLIDDVPGVGKTTLVRLLANLLGLSFQRVQFTPDLMPTDITGTSVLDMRTNDFAFRPGPLFAQVVLADEINRATPKTQAALLEAMQEHQITVDGVTHPLPEPFFVLATQNPVELEGTFPLPEAQLDRFLLRVRLGYPNEDQEERILTTSPAQRRLPTDPLAGVPAIRDLQDLVAGVALEHPVRRYIVSLARATRDHPELSVGASPRAVEQMGDAARAWSLLDGRDYVLPDDVKLLAEPVLGHRLVPTTDARIRDRTADEILREVLRSVPVPTEFREG